MIPTTPRREEILNLVRRERVRQVKLYGLNEDLEIGFGGNVQPHPWLFPFTWTPNDQIEKWFRQDYESCLARTGKPTWMHLIREEVAELFAATDQQNMEEELVQVAALCVSLLELLMRERRS